MHANEHIGLIAKVAKQLSYKHRIIGMNREDVEQELIYWALQCSPQFDEDKSPAGYYYYMVLHNHVYTLQAKVYMPKHRTSIAASALSQLCEDEELDVVNILSADDDPHYDIDNVEMMASHLFHTLSQMERACFILVRILKYSYLEAGEILADAGLLHDEQNHYKCVDNALNRIKPKTSFNHLINLAHR